MYHYFGRTDTLGLTVTTELQTTWLANVSTVCPVPPPPCACENWHFITAEFPACVSLALQLFRAAVGWFCFQWNSMNWMLWWLKLWRVSLSRQICCDSWHLKKSPLMLISISNFHSASSNSASKSGLFIFKILFLSCYFPCLGWFSQVTECLKCLFRTGCWICCSH